MTVKRVWTLLCLIFATAASAATYSVDDVPNVQKADRYRFTSNPDGILSQSTVATIDSICYDLRRRAIAQVAVVAVDDIEGGDVFGFAYELFSKWGVGRADNDNGLGILLIRDAREIRFVTGRGLEGVLPDAICKRIQMRYMLPRFREGDYDAGMVAGVKAAAALLDGSELDMGSDDYFDEDTDTALAIFVIALLAAFIMLCILISLPSKYCPHCHNLGLKRTGFNRIGTIDEITYVCKKCGKTVVRRRRLYDDDDSFGSGTGGTIIGSGSGSTGGGFGGGSFGGGGAGSRW